MQPLRSKRPQVRSCVGSKFHRQTIANVLHCSLQASLTRYSTCYFPQGKNMFFKKQSHHTSNHVMDFLKRLEWDIGTQSFETHEIEWLHSKCTWLLEGDNMRWWILSLTRSWTLDQSANCSTNSGWNSSNTYIHFCTRVCKKDEKCSLVE